MKLTKLFTVASLALLTSGAFAIDGTEIMTKALDRQKPDFTKAAVVVTLKDKGKVTETRNVGEYGRCKDGLSDIVMMFMSPSSVKGTNFLAKENAGDKADDKWIYTPGLKSTRRVSSADGSKQFVGTDFTYDDMSDRKVNDDKHILLKESEDKGNFKDCYVVESTPVDPKNSQYSKRISWVTKDTFYPIYIEMYDKKGKLLKTNEITTLKPMAGTKGRTYNIPMENIMTNVQTNHQTIMKMANIVVDQPLADGYFTPNFLPTGKL